MKILAVAVSIAAVAVSTAHAQNEEALQQYFGGRTVIVKLDLPGTQEGVDVYPGTPAPIDFARYAARLKAAGTAVRSGDSIVVTRVRVKDTLVEFHLGGGGYGTFGDDTGSVSVPSASKTSRERNLERDVKRETDPARKRAMQEELDDLKRAREREDRQNRAAAADAEETRKQRIAIQRLGGGSRFNVRYRDGVPPGMTPEMLMGALAEYVEFPWTGEGTATGGASEPRMPASGPYKGMSWADALAALGRPEKTRDRMEGTLKVTTAVFSRADQLIQAEFVEGVLVRYSIASR